LLAQVGPVRLVLDGDVTVVSRDDAARRAALRATAKDTRLGGTIRASIDVGVTDATGGCELTITTDVEVAGRIGEFGQAVMQRKSAQLLQQFSQCLSRVATR
jgi:carbon monoxide dehydrogenase subunit G